MNILFLDIDGVLKVFEEFTPDQGSHVFDQGPKDNLKAILKDGDIKIVIISMWREDFSDPLKVLDLVFKQNGIDQGVFDITPIFEEPEFSKGLEIIKWLKDNQMVERYMVVDDNSNEEFFSMIPKENKFAPNPEFGLLWVDSVFINNFFRR